MLAIKILICCFITSVYSKISLNSIIISKPEFTLLTEYLSSTITPELHHEIDTINIFALNFHCEKVSQWFSQNLKVPHTIHTIPPMPLLTRRRRDLHMFFIKHHQEVIPQLKLFLNTFIISISRVEIVFCRRLKRRRAEELIKQLWRDFNFINTVITFIDENRVHTITHNPFEGLITDLNATSDKFPSKLHNLKGYQFNAAIFADYPKMKINKWTGELEGTDLQRINILMHVLNFTVAISIIEDNDHEQAIDDIETNRADICVVEQFFFEINFNLRYLYPHSWDSLVVLVPKARLAPAYKYFFKVFYGKLNIVAVFLLFLIATVSIIEVRLGFTERFMIAYGTLLGIPDKFLDKKFSFIFITWIIFALILTVAFKSLLFKSLLHLSYEQEINTVNDLKKSNLTIYCASEYYDIIMDHYKMLERQTVIKPQSHILYHIRKSHWNVTYIVTRSTAVEIIMRFNLINREINFDIMKETLIFGYMSYVTSNRFPLYPQIKGFLLDDNAYGLTTNRRYEVSAINKISKNRRASILTFAHFSGAFLILGVLQFISILTFLCEYFYYNHKQKKRLASMNLNF